MTAFSNYLPSRNAQSARNVPSPRRRLNEFWGTHPPRSFATSFEPSRSHLTHRNATKQKQRPNPDPLDKLHDRGYEGMKAFVIGGRTLQNCLMSHYVILTEIWTSHGFNAIWLSYLCQKSCDILRCDSESRKPSRRWPLRMKVCIPCFRSCYPTPVSGVLIDV
jgi:hypothetical protein